MQSRKIARRVLGMLALVFVQFHTAVADAQDASCEAFDHDGNGVIETIDSWPLASTALALRECMSIDFSRALLCEAYDTDDDDAISMSDWPAIADMRVVYANCHAASVDEQPHCALLDANADGFADAEEYDAFVAYINAFWPCVGEHLSVLVCTPADLDGDERISSIDQDLASERWTTFQSCIGTRTNDTQEADGLWIGSEELMALPVQGAAWDRVLSEATSAYLTPNLADQNDAANTRTLAKALVGMRLGRPDLIYEVLSALRSVTYAGSESGATSLAVSRELAAYVFAADIIGLAERDPSLDSVFREKLRQLRDTDLRGRTIVSTHEDRPNNWGTHAGATRVAIALYLGDDEDLEAAATIHRAWLGETPLHDGFRFGSLSWQASASTPVGINPRGASRSGIDVDGALPDEMRRGGGLADPPGRTGYPWEALQGATVTTELLARHGYPDAWRWGDDAMARAVAFLDRLDRRYGGWWATGDDRWTLWLVNRGTGSQYPTQTGVTPGKNAGFTDWTHAN